MAAKQHNKGTHALMSSVHSPWLLRLASTLQVAILISLWPSITSSPILTALVLTATLLLALSSLNIPHAPLKTKTVTHGLEPGSPKPETDAHFKTCNISPPPKPASILLHTRRRNKNPIRAQVAPIAAPYAVLARNLDQEDLAWADLMARISHDLRTPLNAVIGFSHLMQNEAFGPLGSPRYQEYARHIQDCGTALLKSAEDTLAMTTALTDKPLLNTSLKQLSLQTLTIEAWQFLKSRAQERSIPLHLDMEPDLKIQGERTALKQILLNLMSEALTHVKPGSKLIVRAKAGQDLVELEIRTTNCPEKFSTDTLALCVARTLLHLQGTSLTVSSHPDEGWCALTTLQSARQHDFFEVPIFPDTRVESKAA